ncbi:hypothetical protein INT45_008819 [Circinella minor]|uniref:Alpha/beta hydrolase fold-3 domain-containing protein n=1 Tax=Circinella minor TaxID=1195481 RepID=A0A8H7S2I5_9FUNG|nr:hypothetical protein INT45_008819 [Circinella minor]
MTNNEKKRQIILPAPVVLDPVYTAFLIEERNTVNEQPFSTGDDNSEPNDVTVQKIRNSEERAYAIQKLPSVIEEDKTIVYNSVEVRLTFLRPLGTEKEKLPAVIFYHGGGFIAGSKLIYGKPVRDISIQNNVTVVFVNYSLAPEVQFPVINEECFSALAWVVENGDSININVNKLAICGDSCGGQIVAATALMAKERGFEEAIKTQIMIYPMTAPKESSFESYELFGNGDYGLAFAQVMFAKNMYFGDNDNYDKNNIYAFPLVATNDELKDLPPALILTAEADVLRDEGESYARRLLVAQVPTLAIRILGAGWYIVVFLC